jgi:hypothetical protein
LRNAGLMAFSWSQVKDVLLINLCIETGDTPHRRANPVSDIPDSPVSSTVKNSTPSRSTRVIFMFSLSLCALKVDGQPIGLASTGSIGDLIITA